MSSRTLRLVIGKFSKNISLQFYILTCSYCINPPVCGDPSRTRHNARSCVTQSDGLNGADATFAGTRRVPTEHGCAWISNSEAPDVVLRFVHSMPSAHGPQCSEPEKERWCRKLSTSTPSRVLARFRLAFVASSVAFGLRMFPFCQDSVSHIAPSESANIPTSHL
jgi:hypothetical protein